MTWGNVIQLSIIVMMAAVDARPPRRTKAPPIEAPTTMSPRWLTPCSGGGGAEFVDGDLSLGFDDDESSTMTDLDVDESVERLQKHATKIIKMTDELKQRYADERFHESVESLDEVVFEVVGLPKLRRPRLPQNPERRLKQLTRLAIDELAAVAPFLHRAKDDEKQFQLTTDNYVQKYAEMLDNPEHGFYRMLCELTMLDGALERRVGAQSVKRSASNARHPSAEHRFGNRLDRIKVLREYRDYLVLRHLRQFLERFRKDLRSNNSR